ncbi:MAG: hypothetical protein HN336_00380 [Lentimicrobiaceae bacterium]|jgi:glucose dehydrogenase|nr:hypothetical protein [Lentimicrobiaceae bacterium]MBT3453806.1 hypothetical protein [Lentimicrobiaceae bacterium]MBT3819485.1 hypothetical protein [Lentimicrobiaceae bacterium]MBT4061626.1 hypothetical protein [Lentimicrobiaceae bacterium]MBT4190179.1 hypothetical protein [Lentimicrobiaceae bacterium]
MNNSANIMRPKLLKILCILTFVGSGFSLISNIFMFLYIGTIRELYLSGSFEFMMESLDVETFEVLIMSKRSYFAAQALVFTGSIYGAYNMWNLKKIGFHIYTICQISLIILTQIFLPNLPFPLFEVMVSLIFITLYAKNIKIMN